MDRIKIPAQSAVSILLEMGTSCRVVNVEGGQVVDTWAFNVESPSEYLSMEHSRSANYKLLFEPGDTLVSNRFRPMLTMTADTSPGYHDTLHAACSVGSNVFYGAHNTRPNCQDNLIGEMAERGHILSSIPCPWNLFEHALVVDGARLKDEPSAAIAGDYVEFKAEMDLLLVCSACPSLVGSISGDQPKAAAIDLLR